jgi:hypothetical protein
MKRRSPAYERAVARALRSRKFRNIQYVDVLRRTDTPVGSTKRLFEEQHYTPADLGKLWGLSDDTIREIFQDEPGVLCRGDNGSRRKRKYVTMRIPESVAMRVHTRLSAKAQPVKVESARARPFPQTY